jgi:L-ascorbate metabolism protein UlaG (beta-lactamase superfamily)
MTDRFPTAQGELVVTPIMHGSVLLEHASKQIYVDPWSQGKFDGLPKADFIFVTDIHQDHLDQAAIDKVKKEGTVIVGPPAVAEKLPGIVVLKNGESKDFGGFTALAVPMYNKKRGPSEGKLFHDKGRGNGYVLTFGGKKIYLSGDTECIDEMKALKDIDVAFVCMNLPYTMPPAEAAECIKAFRPKVLIPYHYRGSNLDELTRALEGEKGIEVRKREWY